MNVVNGGVKEEKGSGKIKARDSQCLTLPPGRQQAGFAGITAGLNLILKWLNFYLRGAA